MSDHKFVFLVFGESGGAEHGDVVLSSVGVMLGGESGSGEGGSIVQRKGCFRRLLTGCENGDGAKDGNISSWSDKVSFIKNKGSDS